MTKRSLECAVCGCGAGKWHQHYNRDTGYGVCTRCVAEEAGRYTSDQLESLYGKPNINYKQPEVLHGGRRYTCLAIFRNTPEGSTAANDFIARTPGASVLYVSDAIYLAHKDDVGEPIAVPL